MVSTRVLSLQFDEFGRAELQSVAERRGLTLAELLGHATRYSLSQPASSPAFRWARKVCKSFGEALGSASVRETGVRLELSDELWRALATTAAHHRIPVERLVEYAGLHLLADIQRGRVSERDLARAGDHGARVEFPQR
jgi:predicted DNA-binding ribbon-helix-helix protein